jgi:hypothetical protein
MPSERLKGSVRFVEFVRDLHGRVNLQGLI